jgi:predicted PilT family ATPase
LKEDVKAAKNAIKSLINDGFSTITHEGWAKLDIEFPETYKRYLIGLKGQTIKSIQGASKCKINTSTPGVVSVVGPTEFLQNAKKAVLRVKEKQDQPQETTFLPGFEPDPFGSHVPADQDW